MIGPARPRPYRLGRQGGDGLPGGDAGLGRLGRLPKPRRQKIAELTGCPHADAASLVDHLSKRDVALTLLEPLSPPALAAARLFTESFDLLPRRVAEAEARQRLGEDASRAMMELDQMGILFSSQWAGGAELVGLLPPLSRSMRPFLWLLPDTLEPGELEATSLASRSSIELVDVRLLAMTLAAVAADPPRMARGHTVHSYDLSKLHRERLCSLMPDEAEIEALCHRLFALGLLAGDEEDRVRVRWKRAEAFLDLPAAARLPLLLSTDAEPASVGRAPGATSPMKLRRLLCGGLADLPGGFWARREALEDAVRVRTLAADHQSPYSDMERLSARAKLQIRAVTTKLLDCLDVHESEGETWLRLPYGAAPDQRAAWVVQPDHEIVAPPEVEPLDLIRLASIADLVRADVVAQFHISPSSVARAAAAGLDAGAILERLSSRAAHDIPEGIDLQVIDWVRQASTMEARRPKTADEEAESFWSARVEAETEPRCDVSSTSPPHRRPAPPALPRPPREAFSEPVASFRTSMQKVLTRYTRPP